MQTRKIVMGAATLFAASQGLAAGMQDDPLLAKVMIDKLEVREGEDHNPLAWEAQAWLGRDLDKLWLKTEGERVDGETEEANLELLYSRAVAPYWDLQAGWRRDFRPEPERDWLAVGAKGLAPYYFEVDATAYVGEGGRTAAGLAVEYELMFTQRLVLSPELELSLYGKDDPETGTGAGLAHSSLGLRLRYEFRREFAPYVGVRWWRLHGSTADYADSEGEETGDTQWVAGIRAWF